MVWQKAAASSAAIIGPYVAKVVRKQLLKRLMYKEMDNAIGEDNFIEDNILGIKPLNADENSLDSYANNVIMQEDVSRWTENDYNFIRATADYDRNWEKRRKVLEYLQYRDREKKLRNVRR